MELLPKLPKGGATKVAGQVAGDGLNAAYALGLYGLVAVGLFAAYKFGQRKYAEHQNAETPAATGAPFPGAI